MAQDQPRGRIVIITGLSGSGKSTALNALEDNGYFCIDNLPVQLLPKFLALRDESSPDIIKLGVGMDIRAKDFVANFPEILSQIQPLGYDLVMVFLEAADQVLVKRFSETRRRHPLAENGSLLEGIQRERMQMAPVRDAAHEVIDTSTFNVHKLRDIFTQKFARATKGHRMSMELVSFGFKHGLPQEADILMDVRFLPNPFYLDELRDLDGRDHRVVEYVSTGPEYTDFMNRFEDLLRFMIPLYQREGKSYLAVAVGCTGGMHRSVTVVNDLAARLEKSVAGLSVRHRDIVDRRENK
jgi:RNase adapter protein RapZ